MFFGGEKRPTLYFSQEYAKIACSKTHPCGHPCGGVKNEEHCLPCLHGCDKNATTLKQDADDMCMICFTEALSAAPAIQVYLFFPLLKDEYYGCNTKCGKELKYKVPQMTFSGVSE